MPRNTSSSPAGIVAGKPVWTHEFKQIKPLLEWNNNMGCVTATYVAPLKKYLMFVTDGGNTCSRMNTYVLESSSLTGPWRLVTYMKSFGEQGYFVNLPSKFIASDGRTAWLCYSGNFAPNWNGEKSGRTRQAHDTASICNRSGSCQPETKDTWSPAQVFAAVEYRSLSIKEQAADHGVGTGDLGDAKFDLAADLPGQVSTTRERRKGAGIDHGPGDRVDHLNLFDPTLVVPVIGVKAHDVRLAVGQVHVDGETGGRVPAGGDASGAAGILKRPRVGRARVSRCNSSAPIGVTVA